MKSLKYIILIITFLLINSISHSKIETQARYVILLDHHSGEILYEKDADEKIYPASMTKIMTAIIVFDLLQKGEISLDEKIPISENAWRMSQSGYSSMFIMLNDNISVENLLRGIIVASGNDACMALAEGISGTEADFVNLMNEKAEEIGMENSFFANSSGINDVNNYSTVRDVALMSVYLIENFPEYYHYFKEKTFTWNRTGGDPITQGNRNPLLYKKLGADGIKTGFLTVEKYSLAASTKVGERRLIAVASGFPTKNSRSRESAKILNWGLRMFDTIQVAKKNEPFVDLNVWLGKKPRVQTYIDRDIYLTVPNRKKNTIKAIVEYEGPIDAPIQKGDILGKLNIYLDGELNRELDIFSNETIKKANIFSRLGRYFNFLVWGDV